MIESFIVTVTLLSQDNDDGTIEENGPRLSYQRALTPELYAGRRKYSEVVRKNKAFPCRHCQSSEQSLKFLMEVTDITMQEALIYDLSYNIDQHLLLAHLS